MAFHVSPQLFGANIIGFDDFPRDLWVDELESWSSCRISANKRSVAMVINDCPVCLEKQPEIDEPKEEVKRLLAALCREQCRIEDGFFGLATPLSKKTFKASVENEEGGPKIAWILNPDSPGS
jgi:hypothetical protein